MPADAARHGLPTTGLHLLIGLAAPRRLGNMMDTLERLPFLQCPRHRSMSVGASHGSRPSAPPRQDRPPILSSQDRADRPVVPVAPRPDKEDPGCHALPPAHPRHRSDRFKPQHCQRQDTQYITPIPYIPDTCATCCASRPPRCPPRCRGSPQYRPALRPTIRNCFLQRRHPL